MGYKRSLKSILLPFETCYQNIKRIKVVKLYTMRRNLLIWCNLVSISKKIMFYVLGVVRIYLHLADLLQKNHDEKPGTKI